MRRLVLLVLPLVMTLAGCSNRFMGPLEVTRTKDRADAPDPWGRPYSIEQQEARGRERYAIVQDDFRVGPPIPADQIGPTGR
jgi:hypothetical protein